MNAIGYIVAVLIAGAAAWILIRRLARFIRTGGRSACDNCPYANGCGGSCPDPRER